MDWSQWPWAASVMHELDAVQAASVRRRYARLRSTGLAVFRAAVLGDVHVAAQHDAYG